jgi:hypothetical protein
MSDDGMDIDQPLHLENVHVNLAYPTQAHIPLPTDPFAAGAAAAALQAHTAPFEAAIALVCCALHTAGQQHLDFLTAMYLPHQNKQIADGIGGILARVESYTDAVRQCLFDCADFEAVVIIDDTTEMVTLLEQHMQPQLARTELEFRYGMALHSAKHSVIFCLQQVVAAFKLAEGLPAHQLAIKEFIQSLPPQVHTQSAYYRSIHHLSSRSGSALVPSLCSVAQKHSA